MNCTYTKDEMITLATQLIGENVDYGDDGFIEPKEADWSLHQNYPTEKLLSLMHCTSSWKDWFNSEIEALTDIRGQEYFDDLLNNPIREPILITIVNGTPHIWDGWHRVAATIVSKRNNLPVILGT